MGKVVGHPSRMYLCNCPRFRGTEEVVIAVGECCFPLGSTQQHTTTTDVQTGREFVGVTTDTLTRPVSHSGSNIYVVALREGIIAMGSVWSGKELRSHYFKYNVQVRYILMDAMARDVT